MSMTGTFVAWSGRKNAPGWIEDGTGCEIWVGVRSGSGYGRVRADGRHQYVHRVRYEREIGPIPEGMQLDHYVCDNGAGGCCNPRHCRPATARENNLRGDGIVSQNLAKTHCLNDHPLSGENLYTTPSGRRHCRHCQGDRQRAYRARVAAKNNLNQEYGQ